MVKVWLNVFPKQWEYAVNKVIQWTRIPNVVLNFRKKTEMNSANLIHQPCLEIIVFEAVKKMTASQPLIQIKIYNFRA
jgi:hypothetical protein